MARILKGRSAGAGFLGKNRKADRAIPGSRDTGRNPAEPARLRMGLGKSAGAFHIPPVNEQEIFAELGEDGIARLVAAFYRKVKTDDLLGPMYPADDWEGSEERLRDFLLFRLGGQPAYLEKRGHPRLRMRHMPFAIGIPERDRWMELMDGAMEETGVSTATRGTLYDFFFQVADFMRNRPG